MRILSGLFLLSQFLSVPAVVAETREEIQVQFEKSDRQLNEVYQEAKAALSEWKFSELQEDQRQWLEYRDSRSVSAALYDGQAIEGVERSNLEFWKAMVYLTETRIEIVQAWMKMDGFPREWEGVWSDGVGGELMISETKPNELEFFLSVVRGPTYHVGMIGGLAQSNGSMARFSVKEDPADPETWLTFRREGGRLEVFGENTEYFHGARAYFEGTYIRLRQLKAEDLEWIKEKGGN